MPENIRFYELIQKHKLPIQIISIHDQTAATIAEVEEKIKPLRERFWDGKDLPFPILLDKDNVTFKAYGASGWPSTYLVDPEGRLVGRFFRLHDMEKYLPKLPEADLAKLLLESTPNVGFQGRQSVRKSLDFLVDFVGLKYEVDDEAKALLDTEVPLQYGAGSSLTAYLNALLNPVGLDFEANGRTIRIVQGLRERPRTPHATLAESRIRRSLEKPTNEKFEGELRNLIGPLGAWAGDENIVPDPLSIMRGKLDLLAKVSFRGEGRSLMVALSEALKPLDLEVQIRNEAIYLVSRQVK